MKHPTASQLVMMDWVGFHDGSHDLWQLSLLISWDDPDLVILHADGQEVAPGRRPIPVGKGSFGQVYRVAYKGQPLAYKEFNDPYDLDREKDLLMHLHHPHVMQLHATVWS